MKKKREKPEPVKKELSWTRKDPEKTDSFVSALFKQDIFHTTPEVFCAWWREVRSGRLSVIKSAVWTDEAAWNDLVENLKFFVKQAPDMMIQLGFETFTGGRQIGFRVDWERSQMTNDGSVLLLRSVVEPGVSLALASPAKYRKGFKIEGLTNVHGARLVVVAAQLPAA